MRLRPIGDVIAKAVGGSAVSITMGSVKTSRLARTLIVIGLASGCSGEATPKVEIRHDSDRAKDALVAAL
ncbi:hypothetical protein ACYOEI_42405, partial [Singulisphaera rosea]